MGRGNDHLEADVPYQPFDSEAEHLDAWMTWLRFRRLRVETEIPEPVGLKKLTRGRGNVSLTEDWQTKENEAWMVLQGRLEAHRANGDAPTLGLELLAAEHDLPDHEKTILIALVVCAISDTLATQVLGGMASASFGVNVNDLMLLTAPEQSSWGIQDWLDLRALFQPGGKLKKARLIKVEHEPDGNPGELMDAYVTLTNAGFRRLTGARP